MMHKATWCFLDLDLAYTKLTIKAIRKITEII